VTEPTPDREVLDAARSLTDALGGVQSELQRLNQRVSRSRHMIVALAISLAIDLALTIVVAIFAVQAHDASDRATSATASAVHATQVAGHAYASNYALCQASNTARHQTVGVWKHLLDEAGPPKTPAARRFEASFIAYIQRTYRARNCKALGAPRK
jgi:hypothetical protein